VKQGLPGTVFGTSGRLGAREGVRGRVGLAFQVGMVKFLAGTGWTTGIRLAGLRRLLAFFL
jgi:hypothetical protein